MKSTRDLAERIAAKCGAVICKRISRESPPDGLFDAVLYNLDDVPRDERTAVLERLPRRQASPSHGGPWLRHHREQVSILNRYGVAAARRLHAELFLRLFTAARQRRETVPPDNAGTDLTWVNLVK